MNRFVRAVAAATQAARQHSHEAADITSRDVPATDPALARGPIRYTTCDSRLDKVALKA